MAGHLKELSCTAALKELRAHRFLIEDWQLVLVTGVASKEAPLRTLLSAFCEM
jgi:hypothetical protein